MCDVLVPVSIGELIDKITILQLKKSKISNEDQLANINRELEALQQVKNDLNLQGVEDMQQDLASINNCLWDTEDSIRVCESQKDFGPRFISLARSVYKLNDKRSRVKKDINITFNSSMVEEKSYEDF